MYHAKERKRGYNQAETLARLFAAKQDLPCLELLFRIRNTTPQSTLNSDERMENITGAMKLNDAFKNEICGKNVLVTDDILTTGSSLNECAKVLINSGAAKVYGLCMCSVEE